MKILIVRHGDPDYSIDSLTEKGWREAEFLSERLKKLDIKQIYVSPLGRAKDTIKATLEKTGKTAIECEWLKEFPAVINRPDRENSVAWDWLPADWTKEERFYDVDTWGEVEQMKASGVKEEADRVAREFDKLLEKHGYKRCGKIYEAVAPNNDTIVLVCHFGLESVLLSHLFGISPMIFWHNSCALPTSVTTLITEERREGIANFRMNGFGDISHLYANDEEPAFAARFCECFTNEDERHD